MSLGETPEAFSVRMLPRVSRTFALGISELPAHLAPPTRLAYLLCRIADAIEDQTDLPRAFRSAALATWQSEVVAAVGESEGPAFGVPVRLLCPLPGVQAARVSLDSVRGTSDGDEELVRGRALVLEAFSRLPWDVRRLIGAHVLEMSAGMAELLQDEHHHPIETFPDLERYCYFVAGTVGHVLTGLFVAQHEVSADRMEVLHTAGPRFGIGLQLVNIVKDAAGDLVESRCFIPRDAWPASLPLGRAASAAEQASLLPALHDLAAAAKDYLADAQRYVVALPPTHLEARRFCALALHLALLTLRACRTSDSLADASRPVKIAREAVMESHGWLQLHAGDDQALAERYAALVFL